MRFFIKSLLLLVFATACSTISLIPPMTLEAAAETAKFAHKGLEKDAERYERFLQSHWKPGKRRAVELIAMGGKSMAKDPRAAAGSYAMAVVAEPANATAWIGLAEALLAITPDPSKGSERFDIPVNASGAAYIAYERATATPAKARALAVLGSALKRRAFWRPETLRRRLDP